MKVACTVLEGESGGNPTDLLGIKERKAIWKQKTRRYKFIL